MSVTRLIPHRGMTPGNALWNCLTQNLIRRGDGPARPDAQLSASENSLGTPDLAIFKVAGVGLNAPPPSLPPRASDVVPVAGFIAPLGQQPTAVCDTQGPKRPSAKL